MKLPLRPGWRRATAEEVLADRQKRYDALEVAIDAGLIADRDVDQRRAEIHEFAGYDRKISDDPLTLPRVSTEKPRWQGFKVDDEILDRGVKRASAFIDSMVTEWMRDALAREEEIAKAALVAGCGYAVVEERSGGFIGESLSITYHYVVSPWIPPMRRLDFPSWDAWEAWQQRGRPL